MANYQILIDAILNKTNLQQQINQIQQTINNIGGQQGSGIVLINANSNNAAIEQVKNRISQLKSDLASIDKVTIFEDAGGNVNKALVNYTNNAGLAEKAVLAIDQTTQQWEIDQTAVTQNLEKMRALEEARLKIVEQLNRENELQGIRQQGDQDKLLRENELQGIRLSENAEKLKRENELQGIRQQSEQEKILRENEIQGIRLSDDAQKMQRENELQSIKLADASEKLLRENELQGIKLSGDAEKLNRENELQGIKQSDDQKKLLRENELQGIKLAGEEEKLRRENELQGIKQADAQEKLRRENEIQSVRIAADAEKISRENELQSIKLASDAEKLQRENEVQSLAVEQKKTQELERRSTVIEKTNMNLEKMAAASPKAFNSAQVQNSVLALQKLEAGYKAGTVSQNEYDLAVKRLNTDMSIQTDALHSANKAGYDMGAMIDIALKKMLAWASATTLIYGSYRELQKAIQYIQDLNKEMTNISLVTGETGANVGLMSDQFNKLANELGSTTLEVAKGSVEWLRAGYNAADTMQLLQASTMQSKLGNIDAAESTKLMIASLHGFNLEAKDSMGIVDKLISLDNSYATSTKDIATAMSESSSVAKMAGVSFDQLASYVTVVSSVTQQSAETVGNAFKTMMTRMTQVKAGAVLDDMGEPLNNVEKVLTKFNIALRDSTSAFRPMGDVIDDVGKKWNTFTNIEQAQIATAIAGTRQQNIFMATMQNYSEVLKAQGIEADSAGLAQQRYAIYLNSTEAAMNKFTTAWEKLVTGTTNSDTVKFFINMGTALLGVADAVGVLNLALVALAGFIGSKLLITIPFLTQSILNLGLAQGAATLAATTFASALGPMLLVGAVLLFVSALDKLDVSMTKTYENFEKSKQQTDSNITELRSLAEEYGTLANKTQKSSEDIKRLLDIQTILNTKYDLLKQGINLYTDAIDLNSTAIANNITAIQNLTDTQVDQYLKVNKAAYDQAQDFIKGKGVAIKTDMGVLTPDEGETSDQMLQRLAEKASLEKNVNGMYHQGYLELLKQLDAAKKISEEYKYYSGLVNADNHGEKLSNMPNEQISASSETVKSLADLQKAYDTTSSALSGLNDQMNTLIDNFDKTGKVDSATVESLKKAFGEDYTKALTVQNDVLKLNKDAIKELTVAKADLAVAQAQEAYLASYAIDKYSETTQKLNDQVVAAMLLRNTILDSSKDTVKSLAEQKKAYDDLLKMVIDIIKQQKEAEKQALQDSLKDYKDMIDEKKKALEKQAAAEKKALQDQLDGYTAIINAEKELIKQKQHAQEYQDQIAAKNKEISDIDAELLAMQFDNSESANARRLQLEADRAARVKELNKLQNDESVTNQQNALDKELSDYEKQNKLKQDIIDRNLAIEKDKLDAEYKLFEDSINAKIKSLDDYLKSAGLMQADAMKMLQNRTNAFYQSLLDWNRKFGDSVQQNIIDLLNTAFNLQLSLNNIGSVSDNPGGGLHKRDFYTYEGGYKSIQTGKVITKAEWEALPYHDGGIVGGKANSLSGEVFTKLMRGEGVVSDKQMINFMNKTLPNFVAKMSGGGDIKIDMPITITGNADKSVAPIIKNAVYDAVNQALRDRGVRRDTFSYSV